MKDKSLDIFLMVIFGIGGIAILIMAWAQPMSLAERILTISVGSIGLVWVLVRALWLRSLRDGTDGRHVAVEVNVRNGQVTAGNR
jgi:hypothetical protein